MWTVSYDVWTRVSEMSNRQTAISAGLVETFLTSMPQTG